VTKGSGAFRSLFRSVPYLLAAASLAGSDLPAPRLVLSGTEVDDKASLTADGRFLAMTDWSSGDLALRDLATGQTKRLNVKSGGWEADDFGEFVILSPDQRQLIYVWHEGSAPGHLRIVANQPGAKPRILVRNSEFPYILPSAWSPDGKSVLVHLWKKDYTAQLAWVSVADGSLTVLRSLDWRGAPLKAGGPRLSPDGRYIAYSALVRSGSPDSRIYLLSADGASEREIVKEPGVNEAPVWTPDGTRLLFNSNRSGRNDLWSVPVRDGMAADPPKLAARDIGKIYPIGLTRSGSLYYVQERGSENIFLADLEPGGGQVRSGPSMKLTENAAGSNRGPAWSPDGQFIAFKRRGAGNRPGYDMVVRSLATAEEKTYVSQSLVGTQSHPAWFPDSKSLLVALSDNQNRISFHRLDLATGVFAEIVPGDPSYLALAALSPDGKVVYIATHDDKTSTGGVIAFEMAGAQSKRVFQTPGFVNNLALRPDGRALAIARSVSHEGHWEGHLLVAGTDGSDVRDLYASSRDIFGGGPMLAWTKDGRSILFAQGERDWQLMRIPGVGGQPELAGLTTTGLRHDLALNPDGSRIAFGHGKFSVKETMAIDHLSAVWEAAP
jgi:Tol biopolymer transport system component